MRYSPLAFRDRATTYFHAASAAARAWYDYAGNWISPTQPPETRERYWLAFALYATGDTAFADWIVRKGVVTRSHMGDDKAGKASSFDIFHSNVGIALLHAYGDLIADDVREILTALAREAITSPVGDRSPGFQFHGYNDNMPAKASMGLILAGERLGDDAAVQHGVWNLRQLRAQLSRRGVNSECNSPTYTPVTIHALAEIAEHARNEEARDLALKCEERLWIDLAARFHPELGTMSGPHVRAYTTDSIASVTCGSSLLWFTLGDLSKASPMELFDPDPRLVVHHEGDYAFNIAQMTWFASGTYHVPDLAMSLFRSKTYPFRAVAMCEVGDRAADNPAHPIRIETMLTPEFTVGTMDTPWLGIDQATPYVVTYKLRDEVSSFRDVGTVYSKLVINDERPGDIPPAQFANSGESGSLSSYSGHFTLQSDATVLQLTHPLLTLGGPADGPGDPAKIKPLSRLSEMVIFPTHFGGHADEILIGGARREAWTGDVPRGAWICCRRGRLLIAVHPLAYTRDFGEPRLTLETINNYEVIRATYYDGDERIFKRDELRSIFGGFVAEHASVYDYPSLSAFSAEFEACTFTDFYQTTRRSRYTRAASTVRPGVDMEISWCPGSPVPRFATIDGVEVDLPCVAIDGVEAGMLPIIDEGFDSLSTLHMPFEGFPVSWGPPLPTSPPLHKVVKVLVPR